MPLINPVTQNTTSITFNVTKGYGSVDSYIVVVGGKNYSYNATQNKDSTLVVVGNDLTPGHLYTDIKAISVSNSLQSRPTEQFEYATSRYFSL